MARQTAQKVAHHIASDLNKRSSLLEVQLFSITVNSVDVRGWQPHDEVYRVLGTEQLFALLT